MKEESITYNSYDGTNIYAVLYSPSPPKDNEESARPVPFENDAHVAIITRGPFFIDTLSSSSLIWLAFIGGDYLNLHPKSKIPNFSFHAVTDPIAWAFDLDYQLHPIARSPVLQSGAFQLNPSLLFKDLIHYPEVREPPGAEEL